MLRNLLICGLIAGACAGLLATGFAELAGEPSIDRAISFEARQSEAAGEAPEPELVSRDVQRTAGLLTGAVVYGLALGGLFALAFGCVYGRVARTSPRRTAFIPTEACRNSHSVVAGNARGTSSTAGSARPATTTTAT